MSEPRLWLTSMCQAGCHEDIQEMIEPVLPWLDGVVWSMNDCIPGEDEDEGVTYLDKVKGEGKVICRPWPKGRHHVPMNDTLYCGPIEEGDYVLWADLLERPRPEFVSRIKAEIGPMMKDADLDVLAYYGKPYLIRFRETMEYRGSPHWYLTGHNGRAMDWAKIEPDETKVRFNARPLKRMGANHHWALHYAKYHVTYPAGSNSAQLGIEIYAQGRDLNQAFAEREQRRLAFRWLMKERRFPVTMEGLKAMLTGTLDDRLKEELRNEKVLSDVYHLWHGRGAELKDTHRPQDALPIL